MSTPRQKQMLDFISADTERERGAPNFDDIARAVGLGHKSGARRVVFRLEDRGFVARQASRARGVTVLRAAPGKHPHALPVRCCDNGDQFVPPVDVRCSRCGPAAAGAAA